MATAPSDVRDEHIQPANETGLLEREITSADVAGSPSEPILVPRLADPVVTREQVSVYLRAMYPGCPAKTRRKIVKRFAKNTRRGKIGRAVGTVVDNWVRHRRTNYETLIRGPDGPKAPRNKARKMVAGQVTAIMAELRKGSAERDLGYLALRAAFNARRETEGRIPAITAAENEAIVAYLRSWLRLRHAEQQSSAVSPSNTPAVEGLCSGTVDDTQTNTLLQYMADTSKS